jgi:MoxR-like ATPase
MSAHEPTREAVSGTDLEARLSAARAGIRRLDDALGEGFLGQRAVADELVWAVLADGHVLLEGAPGLGKTTLVKTLAAALELDFRRVQFTPDLMPADVIGTRLLEDEPGERRRFGFERGPIFTHVLLADEINRATPRTQSALLEAMQERQVTVFGTRHALEDPFFVIATQNPIEMEGTYPLPEAQLDRFLFKVELASPDLDELTAILEHTTGRPPPPAEPVMTRDDLLALRRLVREVPASSDMVDLAARVVLATHPGTPSAPERVRRYVRYGSSPRGGQALLMAAKARALCSGRLFVGEDDLAAVAGPALRHRLILGYEGEASGIPGAELVAEAWEAATRG